MDSPTESIIISSIKQLGIIDSMGELIRYGELKTNGVRFGCGHIIRSFSHEHIAQQKSLQIMKENS